MRFKHLLLFVCPWLLLPVLSAGPETSSPQWAQEQSDIPASPRVTYGCLDNGLRYALMPNQTPPGQVSIRLLVLAGSLNEQDNELGYAHFVEHMAFRSTRSFPADEKVKFLQGLGVGFGPHVNAETSFTHTVYRLDLPENSATTLGSGLRVMRDFADGLVFDPVEMDRERGVVLSEALAGHDSDHNRDVARFEFFYTGTRIPLRWPIGTEGSIKKAGRAGLQSFYDAWYRPENMVVVIAGDFDPAKLTAQLQTAFASLLSRGTARPAPALGALTGSAKMPVKFFSEPRNGMQAELGTVRQEAPAPDTVQNRLKSIRLEVANRMLRRRLNRLTNQPGRPISAFGLEEGFLGDRFHQMTIVTAGDAYKWPTVLAIAEQELRRALEHGFDVTELAAEQDDFRKALQEDVRLSATIRSEALASGLVDQIERRQVVTFPDERLTQALTNLDQLTVEDCRLALREAWGDSPRYLFITAYGRLIKPTPEQMRAKYQESQAVAVAPAAARQAVRFAYEDFGTPGEVVVKEHIVDLDLWQVRFANGVRLNLKHTDFERQSVRFSLRVGSGRLDEPINQPGLTLWAGPATIFGGLRKHTDDELVRAMNGTHIDVNFSSGNDAFEVSAASVAGELPMALRYVCAYVTDAAFRAEGSKRLVGNLNDTYLNLEQSANGVVAQQIAPFLAGGDTRLGFSPRKMVEGYSMETMGAWLRPVLQTGAMEIALVGDFDVEQAITEVARTFGALPPRGPKPDLSKRLKLQFPSAPQSKSYTYSTSAKNRPVTLALYWPVNEPSTMAEKHRLQLLGLVLQDRLRVQIRVEKGETYAPAAQFDWNDTYPGFANLHCQVDVRFEQVRKLGGAVRELALNLGKRGVTAEELARAKTQYLAEIHRWQRDNGYWISSVLADAQEHPWRLQIARSIAQDFDAATVAEVDALAAKFLTEKNLFQFTIKPEYHRP